MAAIAIYVDDAVICAPAADMDAIKSRLMSRYKMTDGGALEYFLGVRVRLSRPSLSVTLDQGSYLHALLQRANPAGYAPISIPQPRRASRASPTRRTRRSLPSW